MTNTAGKLTAERERERVELRHTALFGHGILFFSSPFSVSVHLLHPLSQWLWFGSKFQCILVNFLFYCLKKGFGFGSDCIEANLQQKEFLCFEALITVLVDSNLCG